MIPSKQFVADFKNRIGKTDAIIDHDQEFALYKCEALSNKIRHHFPIDPNKKKYSLSAITRLWKKKSLGINGIYLWGSVGRGKTIMMDTMLNSLPDNFYRRIHFHRFMYEVHERLSSLKNQTDPLKIVGKQISSNIRILGLDEIFVIDISDAMILYGLLKSLTNNGVILIFTSNTPPDFLYKNGLQRERFLPAIQLIQDHTEVIKIPGSRDYRLETLNLAPTYFTPHTEVAEKQMQAIIFRIDPSSSIAPAQININSRRVPIIAKGAGVIWFKFDSLCGGLRSKYDYIEISKSCHTVIISEIPVLDDDRNDAVRRFIELVDELYDRRVNVIISAEATANLIYKGNKLEKDFERTRSRLQSFQSQEYLGSCHIP